MLSGGTLHLALGGTMVRYSAQTSLSLGQRPRPALLSWRLLWVSLWHRLHSPLRNKIMNIADSELDVPRSRGGVEV